MYTTHPKHATMCFAMVNRCVRRVSVFVCVREVLIVSLISARNRVRFDLDVQTEDKHRRYKHFAHTLPKNARTTKMMQIVSGNY